MIGESGERLMVARAGEDTDGHGYACFAAHMQIVWGIPNHNTLLGFERRGLAKPMDHTGLRLLTVTTVVPTNEAEQVSHVEAGQGCVGQCLAVHRCQTQLQLPLVQTCQ